MGDPSTNVSPQLLYHFSAVSQFKYVPQQVLPQAMVVDLLLKAPQVAQQYPFVWTMLDAPADNTVLLVWIPPNATPATDGCVWLEQEHFFNAEEKGYVLEMHHHKSGFAPGRDEIVYRSRRRYRLVVTPKTPQGAPQPDPNLWIFHYCRNDRQPLIRSDSIALPASITNTLVTRQQLARFSQQGIIPRKEFSLHNPQTWPIMNIPPNMHAPPQGAMMPPQHQPQHQPSPRHMSPAQQRPPPQSPYYPPQQQAGPPPKRYKPSPAAPPHPQPPHDPHGLDLAEEDNSRGDLLDHLSPREISVNRYTQHHEWMEEVLGSGFNISQITPVDIGFGLEGAMKGLTKGLFEPPVFPASRPQPPSAKPTDQKVTVGEKEFGDAPVNSKPLLPDLTKECEELRARAEAWASKEEAEMAEMMAKHKARIAEIRKGDVFTKNEKILRDNFRTRLAALQSEDPNNTAGDDIDLEAIMASVEKELGSKIAPEKKVYKWKVAEDDTPELPTISSSASVQPTFSAAHAPPPPLSSAPLPPLPGATADSAPLQGSASGTPAQTAVDTDIAMGDGADNEEQEPEGQGEGEGFFADALLENDVDMGGVDSGMQSETNGNGGV